MPAGNGGNLANGLNSAYLIVGMHNSDQNRCRCDRRLKPGRINQSVFVNREVGDFKSLSFKIPAYLSHRRMLNG